MKRQAAARALEQVQDGMKLRLGTGSTAKHFVDLLGQRVAARAYAWWACRRRKRPAPRPKQCNIPLTTLDAVDRLDLTVDGADESRSARST